MPDTTRRPIARALWRRRGPIVPDRIDLKRGSSRYARALWRSPRSSPARLRRRENWPATRREQHSRSDVSLRLQPPQISAVRGTPHATASALWRSRSGDLVTPATRPPLDLERGGQPAGRVEPKVYSADRTHNGWRANCRCLHSNCTKTFCPVKCTVTGTWATE